MVAILLALLAAAQVTAQVSTMPSAQPPPSLADLPRGEPASKRAVVDRGWDLPHRHGISSVTPHDGGYLVTDTRYFEGSFGLEQVDAEGRRVGGEATQGAASGFPTVAEDGRVAWTSFFVSEASETGPSLVYVDGVAHPWPGNVPMSVGGFVADHVVVNQGLTVSLLDPAGGVTPLPRLTYASDTHAHLIAGRFERGQGVVDVRTGNVLWRARGYDLRFSPSGRRVVMTDRDGVVVRRTADGRVLWRTALPERGYVDRLVWEDERHLLGVATLRKDSTVLRIGRGVLERATRVASYDPDRPPYVLMNR